MNFLSVALQPFVAHGRFAVSWSYSRSVGLLGRGSARRKAATYTQNNTQTQNKRTQTYTPRVGFEPKILVFERAKAFHALDSAATVIGIKWTGSRNVLVRKCDLSRRSPVDSHAEILQQYMQFATEYLVPAVRGAFHSIYAFFSLCSP
jgi:hypothetical protein